ncbi:MAG: hypothetical protein J5687_03145 [Treponema sp.]|nr:hypothetical protein [Treponema sp.]
MKANRFFEKILYNWPVKVCCLIVAIALYLFHQASLTEKRSFVIPLTVVEEGAVQHTGDFTSNVTVVVRANTEQISSVHSNQLTAYINLNNIAKNGEYNLPVKVKVDDELMGFDPFEIKVKPEYIKIKAETKDLKFIPLEASVIGEPEHGYEVSEITIEPAYVEVTGPESIIENTSKIYLDKVDATGLTQKQTFETQYKSVNKLLSIKETGPFQVTLMVEPRSMIRTINDIDVTVLSLNDKLYLKEDILPVWVTLEGSMPVLEDYIPGRRFVTADFSSISEPGEYDIQLNYNIPSYFYLDEYSDDIVHVTVMEHLPDEQENNEGAGAVE